MNVLKSRHKLLSHFQICNSIKTKKLIRISSQCYHKIVPLQQEKHQPHVTNHSIGQTGRHCLLSPVSKFQSSLCISSFVRHCSNSTGLPITNSVDNLSEVKTTTVVNSESDISSVVNNHIEYIPAPPAPPEAIPELNSVGEVSFESIGLGGYTPVGLVQNLLEYLHVTCDLPWMICISILTVIVRTAIFPLVIKSQRNAVQMTNNLPQLQVIQMKMTEARNSGNHMESMRLSHEMMEFMKNKDISPLKNLIVPIVQAPVFISVFMGLRGCANLPIESMRTAGIAWFPDLTIADPYYLLSVITCTTLLATIELGVDGNQAMATKNMKYIFRALPILIFPFTVNFPAAILWYWVTTNLFSLLQVGFLKVPTVRNFFNIGIAVKRDPTSLPDYNKKGFVDNMKENWTNSKIVKEIEQRQRVDEMAFKQAGQGPLVKTYKYNPTKIRNVIDVKAKSK